MYRLKQREVKREQKFKSKIGLPQMAMLLCGKLRAVILKAGMVYTGGGQRGGHSKEKEWQEARVSLSSLLPS